MKKFYIAFTFALIAFSANAQQPFITTWEVSNTSGGLDITIPTTGTGYNYTVDFGDGTVQNNVTGNVSHTYTSAGVYTVSITGSFPRIYFEGFGPFPDASKIKSIEQWGDIQWVSMEGAFSYCTNLVINAIDAPDLSLVTTLEAMFGSALTFNQSINHWDVSNITNMSGMFAGAESFNQILNTWDVSNVVDMNSMFFNALAFNQSVNSWDVSNVTDMTYMFAETEDFNQSLDNWDVSNVTDMSSMFYRSRAFNQTLNNWNVSNVTDMSYMFSEAENFNQPIDNWNVSSVTNMTLMFMGADDFNQFIDSWDVSNVTNMEGMFSIGLSSVTMEFNKSLNNWDVSSVINMKGMFYNSGSFNQPLNNWDVSNVVDMSYMFREANSFNQSLNNWNVGNVINMSGMFQKTDSFNQPVNNWDVSSVTDMLSMFQEAVVFNQPLNNWDMSNIEDLTHMFYAATAFDQPLNNWDVSNVTDFKNMFYQASSFNQDLTGWQFNTYSLKGFFSYSGTDANNYDAFLSHLATLVFLPNVYHEIGVHDLEYCNVNARNELINEGWYILGDNQSLNCNTITGTILYDENNNGCDAIDIAINGFMVNINDGTYDFTTFVNNGNYNFPVSGTSFTVSMLNYPSYYTVTPPSASVTFTSTDTEQQDFCVTTNQSIEDLNVTLLPISEARPGFEADYQLVVQNMGTQTVANASVMLSFDDTKQSFTSAIPAPSTTTANQLTFAMGNLQPFEVRTVELVMQTFTPPTVNGDDVLNFTAAVTPDTNDHTPVDNTFDFDQIVVNSFDPNDKQVLQGEEIFISETDDYLNYLIRFQNTGTASAINVRILDTLHPKLDYSTIKPVSASHDYRVEITDGNHVEFIFENINLPHEATDEPGSHGFIAYKIKPKSDVVIGDIITGDARIYFDFNAAIITNMVSTEIVPNLSTENFERNKIRLYPNPTNGTLNISSETELEKVELFSLTGNRLLLQESNLKKIDLHQFSEGIYFLKITGKNGAESVEKIVKK